MKVEDAIFEVSINYDKLRTENLWTSDTGERWIKLDVFLNQNPDRFGKHIRVQQSLTKVERDLGIQKTYIGGGRLVNLNGNDVRDYTSHVPDQETNNQEEQITNF